MREELLGKSSLTTLRFEQPRQFVLKMGQYTEAEARYEQAGHDLARKPGGEHPHIAVNLISQESA